MDEIFSVGGLTNAVFDSVIWNRKAIEELIGLRNDVRVLVGHINEFRDQFSEATLKIMVALLKILDVTVNGRGGIEIESTVRRDINFFNTMRGLSKYSTPEDVTKVLDLIFGMFEDCIWPSYLFESDEENGLIFEKMTCLSYILTNAQLSMTDLQELMNTCQTIRDSLMLELEKILHNKDLLLDTLADYQREEKTKGWLNLMFLRKVSLWYEGLLQILRQRGITYFIINGDELFYNPEFQHFEVPLYELDQVCSEYHSKDYNKKLLWLRQEEIVEEGLIRQGIFGREYCISLHNLRKWEYFLNKLLQWHNTQFKVAGVSYYPELSECFKPNFDENGPKHDPSVDFEGVKLQFKEGEDGNFLGGRSMHKPKLGEFYLWCEGERVLIDYQKLTPQKSHANVGRQRAGTVTKRYRRELERKQNISIAWLDRVILAYERGIDQPDIFGQDILGRRKTEERTKWRKKLKVIEKFRLIADNTFPDHFIPESDIVLYFSHLYYSDSVLSYLMNIHFDDLARLMKHGGLLSSYLRSKVIITYCLYKSGFKSKDQELLKVKKMLNMEPSELDRRIKVVNCFYNYVCLLSIVYQQWGDYKGLQPNTCNLYFLRDCYDPWREKKSIQVPTNKKKAWLWIKWKFAHFVNRFRKTKKEIAQPWPIVPPKLSDAYLESRKKVVKLLESFIKNLHLFHRFNFYIYAQPAEYYEFDKLDIRITEYAKSIISEESFENLSKLNALGVDLGSESEGLIIEIKRAKNFSNLINIFFVGFFVLGALLLYDYLRVLIGAV